MSSWTSDNSKMHVLPLRRQVVLDNENNWIYRYAKNITSQAGENGMIEAIFNVIGAENRWCVELGAGDGRYLSNVWPLVAEQGWDAVLIESDVYRYEKLTHEHQNRPSARCILKNVQIEGLDTLDNILSQHQIPRNLDILSIDIDGADYHLWSSLYVHQPRLVIIEFNPTIPSNVDFVQPPDVNIQQGSSLAAMVRLGKEKGYELVASTWLNAFFVPSDLLARFNILDNSLSGMGFNVIGDQIFYLYDGTLVKTGAMIMPWQGMVLDPEDFQVYPKNDRYFRGNRPRKTMLPDFVKGDHK